MTTKFPTGARVRLTATFLRNTGNYTGPDARGKWIVVSCECGLCSLGKFTAVNERNLDDTGPRHFASGNLHAVR